MGVYRDIMGMQPCREVKGVQVWESETRGVAATAVERMGGRIPLGMQGWDEWVGAGQGGMRVCRGFGMWWQEWTPIPTTWSFSCWPPTVELPQTKHKQKQCKVHQLQLQSSRSWSYLAWIHFFHLCRLGLCQQNGWCRLPYTSLLALGDKIG